MTSAAARIELICIGSELLSGRVNTHQSYLSLALLKEGLSIGREASLPDDQALVTQAICDALKRADAVIVCGGLGPTFDDLTREAAAAALGRTMRFQPKIYARLARKFARYRMPVPEENKRQAFVIQGARVLDNKVGSAPGQLLSLPPLKKGGRSRALVLLPGPYSELAPMFSGQVLPHLRRTYAKGLAAASMALHMSGIPESVADEKLKPVFAQARPGLSFTILSSPGQVDFYAFASDRSRRAARAVIADIRKQSLAAIGDYVFGENGETLEQAVGRKLKARGLTLAVAESCTGGMLGQRLTSAPGSSAYFLGGAIAYSNALKTKLLGVKPATLAKHGAVSRPCAVELAQGARAKTGASLAVSVTGIAGPAGGTPAKPVGLVFLAISGPGKASGVWRLNLPGDRAAIRLRATVSALHLLHRHLTRA